MELDTIVRFHAKEGQEDAVADVMREASQPVRAEPGCVFIGYYRSTRDPRLYYIHSRWKDEAAFEVHAELPHTVRFIARMEPLIDHELKVERAYQFL
ncbi:MAG TPA: putative quinol monooxygenase [Rhizomicrobium sp.]|nr:putative quinol monooxygenase [Rhizomicrobium sp.]